LSGGGGGVVGGGGSGSGVGVKGGGGDEVAEMVDWGRGYGATTPSHLGL
jgi:hypothetical protein